MASSLSTLRSNLERWFSLKGGSSSGTPSRGDPGTQPAAVQESSTGPGPSTTYRARHLFAYQDSFWLPRCCPSSKVLCKEGAAITTLSGGYSLSWKAGDTHHTATLHPVTIVNSFYLHRVVVQSAIASVP